MSSIPNEFPLSLRAWPKKDDTSTALSSLISRINVERGSFRNVTEESLEEEIRQSESGVGAANSGGESDEEQAKEEDSERTKELATTREDILGQLE
jgi:mediator of RNA polymerase II transcription subunit 17, fungi type